MLNNKFFYTSTKNENIEETILNYGLITCLNKPSDRDIRNTLQTFKPFFSFLIIVIPEWQFELVNKTNFHTLRMKN